ncbi:MAG: hypothetical protein L0154_30405 [Chloroflexi bacterium]|nr:hypothetical protein [Chloroflexota bacterium]
MVSGYSAFDEFRIVRTIEEEIWVKSRRKWVRKKFLPKGTLDSPPLLVECTQPPRLFSFDAPGLAAYNGFTGEINLAGEGERSLLTDPTDTRVVHKLNAVEYIAHRIQGKGFETPWERISKLVNWYSIIDVSRINKEAKWHRSGRNMIKQGQFRTGVPPRD